MNGDGQANGLIGAWLNAPLAKDVFKTRLDEGMAKSIFESERQLGEMAIRAHPSLAKYKTRLGWGYKMVSRDIAKKEASGGIEKQKRRGCGNKRTPMQPTQPTRRQRAAAALHFRNYLERITRMGGKQILPATWRNLRRLV